MEGYSKHLANNVLYLLSETETHRLKMHLITHVASSGLDFLSVIQEPNILSLVDFLVENQAIDLSNRDQDVIISFLSKHRPDLVSIMDEWYETEQLVQKFTHLNTTNTMEDKKHRVIKILDQNVPLSFDPHRFQINLAIKSCEKINNVVCVRTGSGKTLIASIVCKYWYGKYKSRNQLHDFKVAFLVPTRHLAEQQAKAFQRAFRSEQLQVVSEKFDSSKIKQAHSDPEKHIFFMTHQKLINAIRSSSISVGDFKMFIFDECHHTDDNHPYNDLMRYYYQQKRLKSESVPLILGLTASLGAGETYDVADAMRHLIKLCSNLDCRQISYVNSHEDRKELAQKVPTSSDDIILDVGQSPKVDLILRIAKDAILRIIEHVNIGMSREFVNSKLGRQEFENRIYELKTEFEIEGTIDKIVAIKYIIELHLFYGRVTDLPLEFCLAKLVEFKEQVISIKQPLPLERKCLAELSRAILELDSNRAQLDDNWKLNKLVQTICGCHAERSNSRGLVLVRTRNHVKALCDYLNKTKAIKQNGIKATRLVGQGDVDGVSMNQNDQLEAIEMFKSGEFNLLVATDIAQEGLDVAECYYVIRYEFVSNEIGTIQSKGRARAEKGRTFLVTQTGSLNHHREKDNQIRMAIMNEALDKFAHMDQIEFEKIYQALHSHIEAAPLRQLANHTVAKSNGAHGEVYCSNCGEYLMSTTEMRHREPSYLSLSEEFIQKRSLVRDKVIHCLKSSCNNRLGQLIEIRNSKPLYMIDIKGVKFKKSGGGQIFEKFNKWSKAHALFSIKSY